MNEHVRQILGLRSSGSRLDIAGDIERGSPPLRYTVKEALALADTQVFRVGRHVVIAEEAIRRLELRVVERLRDALPGLLSQAFPKPNETLLQPEIAKVCLCQLLGEHWNTRAVCGHGPGDHNG